MHTPGPCIMCNADTGRHPAGTGSQGLPCGCQVAGYGLLPHSWHIHFCPLHAAAPDLLAALVSLRDAFAQAVPPMHMQEEWRPAWNATSTAITSATRERP